MAKIRLVTIALLVFVMTGQIAGAAIPGIDQDVPPYVQLPADQIAHPDFANEWWYTVGHLVDDGGHSYGFEVGLYRLPEGAGAVYRTDVAITDADANRFHRSMTFVDAVAPTTTNLDLQVGNASLSGLSPSDMRLAATLDDGAHLDLQLVSVKRPMPVGGQGFLPFGNGSSYSYSLTNLDVSGSLQVDGTTHQVTGTAWQDHQWGDWAWDSIRGWTAMTIQLDGDIQINVSDHKGPRPSATVLTGHGRLLVSDQVTIRPTGVWQSPHTGIVYCSGWVLRIKDLQVRVRVEPAIEDQELPLPSRGPVFGYWEGASDVAGVYRGRAVSGQAYTELLVPPSASCPQPPRTGTDPRDLG